MFSNDINNKLNTNTNTNANGTNALLKQAIETKQTSLLLNKYLMTLYLEESLKKRYREDEEHAIVRIIVNILKF